MKEINDSKMALLIAKEVEKHKGRAYFVGGYVRDKLLEFPQNDIDIEVHNIEVGVLENILSSLGKLLKYGNSFGIYSLKGYNIDIALPRIETLNGVRHQDFDVIVDPYIGTYKASSRRDFTINSLMEDIITHEIIDHHNGLIDLKNKIIRHVNDEKFCEDSLRVLRACQFASRFEFSIAEETINLCKTIDITKLSKERIFNELQKALIKSKKPSIFFYYLGKMNNGNYWFKEVYDLIGVQQNPIYHAEGDCYTHTMNVIDNAANYLDKVTEKTYFMMASLCHDFGKVNTTEVINGVIHSYKHEISGVDFAKTFIKRISAEKDLIKYVTNMVLLHMRPSILMNSNSKIKKTNFMFYQSISPNDLIYLSISDTLGRISINEDKDFSFLFNRLEIFNEYMSRRYVTGEDLIKNGVMQSKNFKDVLNYALQLRLAGVNYDEQLKQTISYAKKLID